MLKGLIQNIQATLVINKASKLNSSGRWDEAVETYRKVPETKVIERKRDFLIADVFLRASKSTDAITTYREAISLLSCVDVKTNDEEYMPAYARHWLDVALRRIGDPSKFGVLRSDLQELGKKASFLARSDFPIP